MSFSLPFFQDYVKRFDYISFFISLALFATGCVFIYTIGAKNQNFATHWLKQFLFGCAGLICYFTLASFNYKLWGKISWVIYIFSLVLLIAVLLVGDVINSARCWISIPGTGLNIQPGEFAKPATLLFMSWAASIKKLKPWPSYLITIAIVGVPVLLILKQPDMGTAIVFVPLLVATLFLRGISWKIIGTVTLMATLAFPVFYMSLSGYQKERILFFLNPADGDANSKSAYTVGQSRLAIGSGGFSGKWESGEHTLHSLGHIPKPVAPSDLIYSVIGEEGGFIATSGLLATYILLILRCFFIASKSNDDFGTFLCSGVALILFIHIYVNIGMNVGAAPVIGIPLPFISYGGSSILSFFILLGLVQSVYRFHKVNQDK